MPPILTYAISTLGERLHTMQEPPIHPDLHILVVWQSPTPTQDPPWFSRQDVTILRMEEKGLSKSRNMALTHATTPFLWIVDDDITPSVDNALLACDWLTQHPTVDAIAGQIQLPDASLMKSYPHSPKALRSYQTAGISSIELILNLDKVKEKNIFFDTKFGLGAKWTMGEEFIFLCDLIKKGGRVYKLPLVLATHPYETTGKNYSDPTVWKASSAAVWRALGPLKGILARLVLLYRKRSLVISWKDRLTFLFIKP